MNSVRMKQEKLAALHTDLVIPAHPLALTKDRKLDERRQKVLSRYYLEGVWTLNKQEVLTKEQSLEIDRVYTSYPELNDDDFVKENLDRWLS